MATQSFPTTVRSRKLIAHQLSDEEAAAAVLVYQKSFRSRKILQSNKNLTPKMRHQHEVAVRAGEDAGQQLVESMLKLSNRIVHEIAEMRYGKEGAAPLIADLESEASAIVLESARTFDPSKAVIFSRWAAQQVRNNIRSQVMEDNSAGLKIFASWSRMRRRAIPERQELALELGREPTMQELKDRLLTVCLEWAYDHLRPEEQALPDEERKALAMAKLRKQGTLSAIDNLEDVLNAGASPVRLDKPFSDDDGGGTWGSLLPDGGSHIAAVEKVENEELRTLLMESIRSLNEREQTILLYRYGFVDGELWTYKAIGDLFDISAERVRQIEEKAREQLRNDVVFSPELHSHLNPDG